MILGIASGVGAAVAVALLIVGITYSGGTLVKVLLFVTAFLVLLLAGEIFYLFMLTRDTKPNYFLFNSKTNRNIPVQKLTFADVNSRMNKYLSTYAPSEGKLWTDRALDNPYIDMDTNFRPIVAYKLLYDLAEFDSEAGWKCFLLASDETVEFIANGLEQNAESEMAKTIKQLKASKPLNLKYVRDYLVGNRKYIQRKMFKYVTDNIDEF